MPDFEQRFWKKYRDQGFEVVALNPRDGLDDIGEVEAFTEKLGVTYTVGLELSSQTYNALTLNFEGLNPFPVDVLVDRNGVIRHVTREYDADELEQLIEELLAE